MKKTFLKTILFIVFTITNVSFAFAAKYTICSGKEFNTRIKMSLNSNNNSSTPEYTITGFQFSPNVKGNVIDISEDGDRSVLAYIDNNIIYYVSDEDVYLNNDCSYMFDKFINLKRVNLTDLNFSKLRKTNFMFGNCKYLDFLDMDNDTEIKLSEMIGMFFDCQSIRDLNLSMINTKSVKSFNSLFYNCKNLQNIIINPSIFVTNNVTNYDKMYYNCISLKSNYNLRVTDIDESKYKTFTRPGSEFLEGLLRDYDYDYDELVLDNKNKKIDNLNSKLSISSENQNTKDNIDKNDIEKSKQYLNVELSPDSDLYSLKSDDRIKLDGKMNTSKYVNADTLKDVPILKDETTFVDKLVPKNKSTKSEIVDEDESDDENVILDSKVTNDVKGILRPDYSDVEIESSETYKVDDEIIDFDINEINKFDISNYYPQIIFLLAFVLIITGVIISNVKNKNDDL